jgi:hypothetical protein
MSGRVRLPRPSELCEVRDLHHFARCLEARYGGNKIPDYSQFFPEAQARILSQMGSEGNPPRHPERQPEELAAWREEFDCAIYTSLLLGAVFARAYTQPFVGESSLSALGKTLQGLMHGGVTRRSSPLEGAPRPAEFSEEQIGELLRCPVFDFQTNLTSAKEELFGPVAEWFIASALEGERRRPPPATPAGSQEPGQLRRKMRLFDLDPTAWP